MALRCGGAEDRERTGSDCYIRNPFIEQVDCVLPVTETSNPEIDAWPLAVHDLAHLRDKPVCRMI